MLRLVASTNATTVPTHRRAVANDGGVGGHSSTALAAGVALVIPAPLASRARNSVSRAGHGEAQAGKHEHLAPAKEPPAHLWQALAEGLRVARGQGEVGGKGREDELGEAAEEGLEVQGRAC